MVLMPEPLFAAVEAVEPPRPLLPARARRARGSTKRRPASSPRHGRVLAAVRPLRGRRRAGARPPRRRRALGRRLRAVRGRGRGAGRDRGGRPAGARGDGQRAVGDRRVVRRRAARVPPVHAAGRRSGAGRCPRCCARATTARSPAGAGPRRWPARSRTVPTSSRPGAACPRQDQRALEEFGFPRYRGASPPGERRRSRARHEVHRPRRSAVLRNDVPDFAPGDNLKVHVRVVEGNRERIQVFQGHVIAARARACRRPSPSAR